MLAFILAVTVQTLFRFPNYHIQLPTAEHLLGLSNTGAASQHPVHAVGSFPHLAQTLMLPTPSQQLSIAISVLPLQWKALLSYMGEHVGTSICRGLFTANGEICPHVKYC